MHWSEKVARSAIEKVGNGGTVVINSGVSLSAPVHIGHSREFITAALVHQAVRSLGGTATLVAYADDLDPLRKVYPFLPQNYARWVGCPLARIPDPWGCHANYAEHHLEQLLAALQKIGIEPTVVRSSEMYRTDDCSQLIRVALAKRSHVGKILTEVSGKRIGDDYWPFSPECPSCSSVAHTKMHGWDGDSLVSFSCTRCGNEHSGHITNGGGKLPWRIDWPLRWSQLRVTVEPCGQDHASAGGSYESGVRIAREIFGHEPPLPIPYAWLHLKSGGAMHSSSGKTVSVADAADMYPRALLWWMVARKQPHDTIRFDPVESQLEEARLLRNAHQDEALGVVEQAVGVAAHLSEYPRGHLIIAAQLGGFNPQQTLAILQRSAKYAASTIPPTQDDLDALHVWLNQVATQYRIDGIRSTDSRPTIAEQFVGPIQALLRKFESIEWSGEAINNAIHEVSRESEQTPKALFAELYRLILGPSYGPKIGWLFESIGKNRVMELLR